MSHEKPRVILLFNSRAGSAGLLGEAIKQVSRNKFVRVVALDSEESDRQVLELLKNAPQARWVIAGGDGTLHAVVNRVFQYDPASLQHMEFGVIPAGTGNDFARSLGAQLTDLERLCLDPEPGELHQVDLMQVNQSRPYPITLCLNSATGGIGGEIASRLQSADKRAWGPFAYWVSVITSLADLNGYRLEIDLVDAQGARLNRSVDAYGMIVSNGRFIGGGFPIAPDAAINDSLLDITLVTSRPGLELLAAGLVAATGHIERSSAIERYRASELRVVADPSMPFSLDGEPTMSIDSSFKILPGALNVRVLHEAPGLQPNDDHQ